jgi:predicted MFS family arabinose efflux permease
MSSTTVLEPTWEGHPRESREYRRILVALACAGVATFAQLYSPQGILPLVSRSLDVTADRSALLVSAATLGLAAGVLPWSRFADRVGRLPAMRLSLVAATVLGLTVAAAPGFATILALRVLEGFALGGLPALAITYLQEEVHRDHTAIAAGTYVSGTTVGGLLGRIVAAPVAAALGWRWGVAAVVVLSAWAATAFLLLAPPQRGFRRADARVPLARVVAANLRSPATLVLYAQGFLLMGGFVTVYNYLTFRLQRAPFGLGTTATSLLFLAYLSGTWSSRRAGVAAGRWGRSRVLLAAIAVMIAGVLLTLAPWLPAILAGLVVLTVGFFAAHSIASGWSGARARVGRAQAASLYNLFYYLGSSIVGWLGGLVFIHAGWSATVAVVCALALLAAGWAAAVAGSEPD